MRDYFDLLGVPPDARARDIREAIRRRAAGSHPDVHDADGAAAGPSIGDRDVPRDLSDVAIDFVDMTPIVDRMQSAFFASSR